jgi:O-acetyl-ADP-ribose deacetylase (regulator of RNase III)
MNINRANCKFPGGISFELCQGDLTEETCDAIVNAANSGLMHGGGVAGAISFKGGPLIQEESYSWVKKHGAVTHAKPAYTHAGRLPCRYVIHAVGPIWGEGNEDKKLAEAIHGSLQLANHLQLETIAFSPISTGIFGFPKERAAKIFLDTFQAYFLNNSATKLKVVRLTIIDQTTLDIFLNVFESWKTDSPENL